MLIVTTEKHDIYRNLALEEWLLDNAPHLPVLFLYVNEPCVVIGKNQNPWCECRLSLMEEESVPLARRISGGGAVYHDKGNLNVSVIVPRTQYQAEKQYELILKTLQKFSIAAGRLGKNSLAVAGEKFSGHAFCHRRDRTLHHSTLLVSSDLNRLGRYLGPEIKGVETKAVASVPSGVMNLSDVAPGLTVETLSAALIETFREMYRQECEMQDAGCGEYWNDETVPGEEILPIVSKISSTEWKFEHTPLFQVTLNGQDLSVEGGRIVNLKEAPLFEEWRKHHAAYI